MEIPEHLSFLLRNLYAGQEATVRTGHGTTDWFQIGKEVRQGCIWSPCLFNLYAEYIMWNSRLDESQAWIKIARRNINLRYADDTTIMSQWRGTKELLDESEKGEWESWLKTQHSKNVDHDIWSHHLMANRWGKWKQWQIFIILGSKITMDGDCSHKIKRCMLLGKKLWQTLTVC